MTDPEHAPFNLVLVDGERRVVLALLVNEDGADPVAEATEERQVELQLLGDNDAPLDELIRDGRVKVLNGADLLISRAKLLRRLAEDEG